MQTWRNSSTTWNGTYVQKMSSTHFIKVAALQSPIPRSMNKGPGSLGPCPTNGNNKANDSGQQQRPSTCKSMKKPLHSTCSYSKMTGSPPPHSITYRKDSTSHNPSTPFGGKYSNRTTLCTTKSLTLKDIHTQMRDSTLDPWKHPPKKGMNVQLLKKPSQCFAILERVTWNKSNKLSNIVKIMYVILHHLGFRKYPVSCDLDQKWCNNKQNKMPYHWDSFLTLYFINNICVISTLYDLHLL